MSCDSKVKTDLAALKVETDFAAGSKSKQILPLCQSRNKFAAEVESDGDRIPDVPS